MNGITITKLWTLALLLFAALPLGAQTVANFDSPACDGNGIGTYQGIDFSLSPWDCEKSSSLPNDATETISWYANNTSGKFRFTTPSVLTSLRLGSSVGGGAMTIATDAGESTTISGVAQGLVAASTGFTKAASVVTISYSGGWTIELDDLAYGPPTKQASITVNATFLWCSSCYNSGTPPTPTHTTDTPVQGNLVIQQVGAPSVAASINPDGSVSATATVDLSQSLFQFTVSLADANNVPINGASYKVTAPSYEVQTLVARGVITLGVVRIAHILDAGGNPAIRMVDFSALSMGQ